MMKLLHGSKLEISNAWKPIIHQTKRKTKGEKKPIEEKVTLCRTITISFCEC